MRPNNGFMKACYLLTNLLLINVFHVICCLPIFTIGAAMAALNTCTIKMVRSEGTPPVFREYFHAFKEHFRKATAMWLIILVFFALLFLDFFAARSVQSSFTRMILFAVLIVVGVILVFVISYLYPMAAWFDNTKRNLVLNSLQLSFSRLGYTIPIALLNISPLLILIVPWDAMGWMLALDILIWFSGVAYIDAFMWCRLFDKLTEKRETDWFTGEKILKSYQNNV